MEVAFMRSGGVVKYTWEDIEYLIKYCGAGVEEFIIVVENEEDNEVQSV